MNIYITLDYELFLNDITGDVDHCLIIPTKELMKVLDNYQIKATFFVDMAYVYRLNELCSLYPSLQEDYEKVTSQVKTLADQGHKIGLHLHPQWFYSNYNGKEWIVDFEHYKLSDLTEEEACQKFETCHLMLERIIGRKVDSFRAGGFSIQTFGAFHLMMKKCGITKDSTVTYKSRLLSKLHYYDYSKLQSPEIYKFNDDIVEPVENGTITEYPISTSRMGFLPYCYKRYIFHKKKNNNNWGNGGDLPSNRRAGFIHSFLSKIRLSVEVGASIDYQSLFNLNYVYNNYKKDGRESLVILGHPKNFSPLSLESLNSFIDKVIKTDSFKTL
jgi:peptidoglycan/xylan/chitin deacetylase (PgdA/CDA1 family)